MQGIEDAIGKVAEAPVDIEYGEYLAGECSTCHAANATASSDIPQLVGQERDALIRAMVEYRAGVRVNQVMNSTMATRGDDEIAALAGWFSSLE